jgi:hypothetical protein
MAAPLDAGPVIEFASPENRMFNGRYATDPLRVALSLIAGSATYAILMVLWFLSHTIGWGPSFPPLSSRYLSYSGALSSSYSAFR